MLATKQAAILGSESSMMLGCVEFWTRPLFRRVYVQECHRFHMVTLRSATSYYSYTMFE